MGSDGEWREAADEASPACLAPLLLCTPIPNKLGAGTSPRQTGVEEPCYRGSVSLDWSSGERAGVSDIVLGFPQSRASWA